MRAASIGDGVLHLGKPIGKSGVCSPGTGVGWPPPIIAKFDRVLGGNHLTWRRIGPRLLLTSERGDTLALHASGLALNVTGHHWTLEQFNDLRGYTQPAPSSAADLIIDRGTVHAKDACTRVSGSATVTDTTITFTSLRWTKHACTEPTDASLAEVMHRVLSGTINYAIRGKELILYGQRTGLLAYTPSN